MRRKVDDLPQTKPEPKSQRFFFKAKSFKRLVDSDNPRMCTMCKEKWVIRIPSDLVVIRKAWVSKKKGGGKGSDELGREIIINQRDVVGNMRMLLIFV